MGNKNNLGILGGTSLKRTRPTDRAETSVNFKIFRYDSLKSDHVTFSSYDLKVLDRMTVLDALLAIKEHLDPTLTFSYSCRMGLCGSCGVRVNGRERLACTTRIDTIGKHSIQLKPLNNLPIVRDLVTDFRPFFQNHSEIKPYVIRADVNVRENTEFEQSPKEVNSYLVFSGCIDCGLCFSACPTNATDAIFLGPQALAQSYRFLADSRDDAYVERMEIIDQPHSIWNCHFAGTCSAVCPKGVDPAFAIQQLKSMALRKSNFMNHSVKAPLVERGTLPAGVTTASQDNHEATSS